MTISPEIQYTMLIFRESLGLPLLCMLVRR